jgi:hypothetical protein
LIFSEKAIAVYGKRLPKMGEVIMTLIYLVNIENVPLLRSIFKNMFRDPKTRTLLNTFNDGTTEEKNIDIKNLYEYGK